MLLSLSALWFFVAALVAPTSPPLVGSALVTPALASTSLPAHSGVWIASFYVKNTAATTKTFTLACSGVTSCVAPGSLTLLAGQEIDVEVQYTSDDEDPYASLTLSAIIGIKTEGSGSMGLNVGPSMVRMVGPGPDNLGTQVVHRSRPVLRAEFVLPVGEVTDTASIKLWWRGKTDSTLVLRRNAAMLEWEVPSDLALAPGDTATFKVRHCLMSGICTEESRIVQLPADQTPVLDFAGMPFGMTGGGYSAPFGPGLAVNGADLTTAIATPAYVSMGVPRSAGLVYSTATSYPRALIATDIQLPWPTAGAFDLTATLIHDGVTLDADTNASATCTTGAARRCRIALQAPVSNTILATQAVRRWYKVEIRVTSGGTTKSTVDSVEVVLVDRRNSPYGTGWWPSADSRLYSDSAGGRILVGATGSAVIYRGSGDTLYLPPGSSTTNLYKVAGGWELRTRGTPAKVIFDSDGRIRATVDASGNRDSLAYDGSGRLSRLVDPTGEQIAFHYGSVTQKLDSIVTRSSAGSASRRTRISIDTATNQLRYDSLPSPTNSRLVTNFKYLTYGATKGTAQLQARYGKYGSDSVYVSYDTSLGHRPYCATLLAPMSSASDDQAPYVTYRAAELRGYHAPISQDSVYVEATDPRGNWTRARLDRYGQTLVSWDALGVLGRSGYDGHERLLWAEGKVADSGRVYTRYDSLGRVHRAFTLRSAGDTLWLTRVVFDPNGRVIKSYDPQGRADSTGYDAYGRVVYARGISGAVSRMWYRTDGMLDSMRVPALPTRLFAYTSGLKNLSRSYLAGDALSNETSFDDQGRAAQTTGRVRVRMTATQTVWRWRRTKILRDAAGRTDSTVVLETAECTGTCSTPGTFTQVQRRWNRYDSTGLVWQVRDTDTASNSSRLYFYDRLGRVVEVQRNGAEGDSLLYDLAGNVDTTITRRGFTLTSIFDSRGRPMSTVVPGYGTIQRSYGGPADQLTALTVSGFGDSIGGVIPDRKWRYDQRGRLLADTLWTGSGQPRATSYSYDAYDRVSQQVDARGTSTMAYDAVAGRLASVTTPFSDSLLFDWDSAGRPAVARVWHPTGRTVTQDRQFGGGGGVQLLQTTIPSGGGEPGYDAGSWEDVAEVVDRNAGFSLLARWTRQDGDGTTLHTELDSVRSDGQQRLISWKGLTDGVVAMSDSFWYDGAGNLHDANETRGYEAGTNRLTGRTVSGTSYSYTYDAAGNLIQADEGPVLGGLTCRWKYEYDALDRLSTVRVQGTAGGVQLLARYAYDVLGNRIARKVYTTVSGCSSAALANVRYAVQGGHVLYETDSTGATLGRQYVWGLGTDDLVAVKIPGSTDTTYYAVKDRLGSIRAWVTKSGSWKWGGRYRPYGVQADSRGTSPDQPYAWTGREYDPETGFYFLRARYYDPRLGRFTQEDPIGEAGGANLYAYVDGQPMEARDPSGLVASPESYSVGMDATESLTFILSTRRAFDDAIAMDAASLAAFQMYAAFLALRPVFEGSAPVVEAMEKAWLHLARTLAAGMARAAAGQIPMNDLEGIRDDLEGLRKQALERGVAIRYQEAKLAWPEGGSTPWEDKPGLMQIDMRNITQNKSARLASVMIHELGHNVYRMRYGTFGTPAGSLQYALTYENAYRGLVGACTRQDHFYWHDKGWKTQC